jgi:hypothetical protein
MLVPMKQGFNTASGSVIGTLHVQDGKNNQDALHIERTEDVLVAVVCDGCSTGVGESSHNEIGAQLGARVTTSAILDSMRYLGKLDWVNVKNRVVDDLKRALTLLHVSGSERDVVLDHLLFTTVALVMTDETTEVGAIGDGVVIVNGERIQLRTVVGGAPTYVAYNIGSSSMSSSQLGYEVVFSRPTSEIDSFLIGSDGVEDFIKATDAMVPGLAMPIGPVSQFWDGDFFKNRDAVRRRLYMANGGVLRPYPEKGGMWRPHGKLPDDTTLIVGKRIEVARG